MMTDRLQDSRSAIARGLIVAGVLLGVSFALRLAVPDYLSPNAAHRTLGVLMGGVVIIYANAVPKALTPLIQLRCEPAAEQAMRRFTGWVLVCGGVAFSLTWAIAPLAHANVIAGSLLGTALLLVIARVALAMPSRSRG